MWIMTIIKDILDVHCSENARFFFYGSFMQGFTDHVSEGISTSFSLVGEAKVGGYLIDFGVCPMALPSLDGSKVVGEVWQINDRQKLVDRIKQLDQYKRFSVSNKLGSLFVRTLETITLKRGGSTTGWVYWGNPKKCGHLLYDRGSIKSGDWRSFKK